MENNKHNRYINYNHSVLWHCWTGN